MEGPDGRYPGIALIYMAAGLAVAVLAGLLIGRLGLERYFTNQATTHRTTPTDTAAQIGRRARRTAMLVIG